MTPMIRTSRHHQSETKDKQNSDEENSAYSGTIKASKLAKFDYCNLNILHASWLQTGPNGNWKGSTDERREDDC